MQVVILGISPGSVLVATQATLPASNVVVLLANLQSFPASQQLLTTSAPAISLQAAVAQLAFDPCANDCPGFYFDGYLVCGQCCPYHGQQCAAFYQGQNTINGCGPGSPVGAALVHFLITTFGPQGALDAFTPFCYIHDICYSTPGNTQYECDIELRDQLVSVCSLAFPVPANAGTTSGCGTPQDPSLSSECTNYQQCVTDANLVFTAVQAVGAGPYQDAQVGEAAYLPQCMELINGR